MKHTIICAIVWIAILSCPVGASDDTLAAALPRLEAWQMRGSVEFYEPDNLYEYINGAAEVFLSYDFERLASMALENEKKQSITVDIYRHRDAHNGFGIYSQEKPLQGNFLPIGTEGYYETGNLNFFRDRYYVKLSGYDLGEQDRTTLETVARRIEAKLTGPAEFPQPLTCFPLKDKIAHSERYISQNFLGHRFLHSAFIASYIVEGDTIQPFIIVTADPSRSSDLLDDYHKFLKGKEQPVESMGDGVQRFTDPYYRSSGPMYLKRAGTLVWGLFAKNPAWALRYIKETEENLREAGLIHE